MVTLIEFVTLWRVLNFRYGFNFLWSIYGILSYLLILDFHILQAPIVFFYVRKLSCFQCVFTVIFSRVISLFRGLFILILLQTALLPEVIHVSTTILLVILLFILNVWLLAIIFLSFFIIYIILLIFRSRWLDMLNSRLSILILLTFRCILRLQQREAILPVFEFGWIDL